MALGWYVVRVKPMAEYSAAHEMTRDGFEVFFPCVKSAKPRAGRADTPLFPGYMFIRCDPEDGRWPSFRPAHHVSNWVRFEGVAPTVPDDIVTALTHRIEEINEGDGLWRRFSRGDKVRVVSDVLDGIGEIVDEAKSPQARAKVLLQFMGRLVQAQVPWQNLEPIGSPTIGSPAGESVRPPRRTRGHGRWIQGFSPAADLAS